MIQIPRRIEQWIKALWAAIISGMANSFLTAAGIGTANAVGIKIDQLSPRQLMDLTIMGGLVGMFMYLKQSPVPPDSTGDTQQFVKTGTVVPMPPLETGEKK